MFLKKWKPSLVTALTLGLALGAVPAMGASSAGDISIAYGSRVAVQQQKSVLQGDTLTVPAEGLAKQLQLKLGGLKEDGTFTLSKTGVYIELKLDSREARVNNQLVKLETAPAKHGDAVYVPLRFVSEAARNLVEWDQARRMAIVSPAYKVVGYFTSWGKLKASEIDASKLTHINYAFANIVDGEVALSSPKEQEEAYPGACQGDDCAKFVSDFKELAKLKQANPHLQTLVSVGGWTWSGRFSDAALTEASRIKFADSAVRFIRENGFDGVDLDWEYPVTGGLETNVRRPEDRTNFTLLLQTIREKLEDAGRADGRHYLLTIASGANPNYVRDTELDKVSESIDFVNIMTYDLHGSWEETSNNNAALYYDPADPDPNAHRFYVEAAVNGHLNAGVPAKKLVLGIPFYGRSWGGCEAENNGLYQACKGGDVVDWTEKPEGFQRYWNDRAKVPYLYNKQTGQFVSYEDEESIGYRAEFIKEKGLGGAMFWELNGDPDGKLLPRLAESLDR
ncbi:glycosyl hydrolase family 18 protein [Paenibacillus sp. UNC499MF]|uniref:glycosyl hydrolase family 18 protein n=1 Tax=Paenibacillus sp. UNC499MF TaxID=1502751 RepID=UPI000CDEA23E|nr:glycosyl hydrolase family 18 protein [Paenibacillus sp. UNC499MF]